MKFSSRYLPSLLALIAAAITLLQALTYAHFGPVTMDEGTYLAKGLLYLSGVYRPFQDFGPWTNKMPLAFLIPGAAQYLLGPGLRTGRYFAVALCMLMLAGLWLAARRSAGKWWAVALLWVVALDPATISYYSTAISQVIVACLLCWMLAFSLGEKRRQWELVLASVLAALIVMTRQNMLPVVPFLILFIFWQYGWRTGTVSLLACAAVLGWFHWYYSPNIYKLWISSIPAPFKYWLPGVGAPSVGVTATPLITPSLETGIYVFWEGIRYYFFAMAGVLAAWTFWPRRRTWQSETHFKSAVFLSLLFACLTALHLWASTGKDYCPYCYSGYLSFFSPCALLLVAISFKSWTAAAEGPRRAIFAALVVILCAGVAYGAYPQIGPTLADLTVPRIRSFRFLEGSTELWRVLANKFGWENIFIQQALSAAAGTLAGILFLAAADLAQRLVKLSRAAEIRLSPIIPSGNAVLRVAAVFLAVGVLLSPSVLLAGSKDLTGCGRDVLASHEEAGSYLARTIPPGAQVYWQNDLTPLPLLYILPQVNIYPPQLNHWYSYLKGGDPQDILRRGFWNADLRLQWLNKTDYALIADQYMGSWVNNTAISSQYDELAPTPRVMPCEKNSIIHVLVRKK